jgi:mRNA interferase MazF
MAKLAIRRGDVVLVDLVGAIGVEKRKVRPCVVVQNDGGNAGSPMTIVAPLTDVGAYKGYPMQVVVDARELGPGGKESVVECGHLRAIDRDYRIEYDQGVLAHLADDTMRKVDAALMASLGLHRTRSPAGPTTLGTAARSGDI